MAKQYWLMKSEPEVYGIDDLEKDGSTHWDGVRNYGARNNMQEMKKGDRVLYYHSNANPPGVVGVAEVVKEAYPDHTQFDKKSKYYEEKASKDEPRWYMVDIGFVKKLSRKVSLHEIKDTSQLSEMVLVNRSRLSVQPVEKDEFEKVVAMAGEPAPE